MKNRKLGGYFINQDVNKERIEFCYCDSGNCLRDCRYNRECDWFININKIDLKNTYIKRGN
ncbi:hypothetical protein [Clostridium perfringens]|uniref:hypothetical protein n=1 Tax=Clostridium perfringens TaxID=1502 RepID=UPI002340E9A7|nr:hypothetical protein [Clostridium perfringens]MDC4245667.1 hypothetical protein [Clostridium perfringens]